ncbi:flagellum-specific ATP synthase [Escherichia coli]|uniref:Flagellum-specific ATP synthase n=1 Tax=Escherichia coli TaxID=562 RepID=A0A2X3LY32_ECOLX|nr:flagellum-specific ATP synthase [Escherichia coli]
MALAAADRLLHFIPCSLEGDDQQDPIADSARAILDGHIVLSRRLAGSRALSGYRY